MKQYSARTLNSMHKIGEIFCEIVEFDDDEKHGEVRLIIGECEDEFKILMMTAEFLTHLVAQKSNAGYEKALDLIRQGAMTYKTMERPDLLEET